jgi:hypothetical protein
MKKMFMLCAQLVMLAAVLSAQEPLTSTTQKWMTGWDNFSEPLNLTKSNVVWSVNSTTKKITFTFNLVGATPSQLYQVALNFFCTMFPATFGQFPNDQGAGACVSSPARA